MHRKAPIPETFAQRLERLLGQAGLSAYRLAQRSGLSRETVSRYLHGEREPTFANVVRIAQALELPLEAFANISLPTKEQAS